MPLAEFPLRARRELCRVDRAIRRWSLRSPHEGTEYLTLAIIARAVVDEVCMAVLLVRLHEERSWTVIRELHVGVRWVDGRVGALRVVVLHSVAVIDALHDRETVLPNSSVGGRRDLAEAAAVVGLRSISFNDELQSVSRFTIDGPESGIERECLALLDEMPIELAETRRDIVAAIHRRSRKIRFADGHDFFDAHRGEFGIKHFHGWLRFDDGEDNVGYLTIEIARLRDPAIEIAG